jgi:hypothetical protein
MPNPYSGAALSASTQQCWEGQAAVVSGVYTPASVQANSAAGVTEGILVADGNLTIETRRNLEDCAVQTDKRYIHQGNMVVWGNASLQRDFSNRERDCAAITTVTTQDDAFGIYNNRVPAETFIYRPDLVVNIPSWMRRSQVYMYQEN